MSSISFCIAGLSWPLPTISNDCTSGMPAASMVASWRLKIAMSFGVDLAAAAEDLRCLTLATRDALAAQVGAHRRLADGEPCP